MSLVTPNRRTNVYQTFPHRPGDCALRSTPETNLHTGAHISTDIPELCPPDDAPLLLYQTGGVLPP